MVEKRPFAPPTFGGIPEPEQITDALLRYNIQYALVAGFRPLELDLYLPTTAVSSAMPVVAWVHGGGYAGGHRRSFAPWYRPKQVELLAREVNALGFAFVSVDYRLGKEANFPSAIHDLNAALRWLTAHHDQLSLKPEFVLWGESAGAHLAAMTMLTKGDPYFEGTLGAKPAFGFQFLGLLDWFGAANLNSIVRPMNGTGGDDSDVMAYPPEYYNLGAERWRDPEWLAKASPVNHATGQAPPTLIMHGTADTMVPIQQSYEFAERLQAAGTWVELVEVPGAEHAWMGARTEQIDELISSGLNFIAKLR